MSENLEKLKALIDELEPVRNEMKESADHLMDKLSVDLKALKATLPAVLEAKLAKAFTRTRGETEDGKSFTTLFLSTIVRQSLVESMTRGAANYNHFFDDRLAPVLKTLDENFSILGTLAPPSVIRLAPATNDLVHQSAVFVFVTIEDTADLAERLEKLGLSRLLAEGDIGTVDPVL